MDVSIILVVNTLIIIIVGLLLKNYLSKYMDEKGKNLATKEDIGEITSIVEKIKAQLAQDTEVLKANLSLKNQNIFSIKAEERKALIDFHAKFSAWLNLVTNARLSSYDIDNYSELNNIIKSIEERKVEFESAESFITLFMHDDEFMKLKQNLVIGTIELGFIVSKHTIELKGIYTKYELKFKTASTLEEHDDIFSNMHKEVIDFQGDYNNKLIEKRKEIQMDWANMTKMIKSRIEKVMS